MHGIAMTEHRTVLASVFQFLVKVISSMANAYRLPRPLPWAALAPSLAAAEDCLARLDERLRSSPIQAGWIARTHFADSCASLWLDGDLVPLEIWCCTTRIGTSTRRPAHWPGRRPCSAPAAASPPLRPAGR